MKLDPKEEIQWCIELGRKVKLKKMNRSGVIIRGLSLNIAGLNNPLKTIRLYNLIKKEQSDIICLQETHLRKQKKKYLKEVFREHLFHAEAKLKKWVYSMYWHLY